MAETLIMCALKRQYGKTLGLLHSASSDRVRLMADLAHLAAVIHMFSPGEDVEAIPLIRPYNPHGAVRGRLWSRMALDVLREAGEPLATLEIARRIAKREGVTDRRVLKSIECTLHAVLPKRASVLRVEGSPKRWSVKPPPAANSPSTAGSQGAPAPRR